ncbi:DUF1223 domain-containing protein [Hyphomicrobium sp. 1Nfss2.1]|uniref:DUF1223 domain-containing protein n=1 Tax=Hyphomicrobium sp. 1Nfss2.1 TaxID=3413936 RepID=UPI003C7C40D3
MHARAIATLLLGSFVAAGSAAAAPPTVLELFTSQGCSSCPPADRLFEKLAHDDHFIVLSLPVDYWDRLGWKDTFAKHAFTERQRAYAIMRGDQQVYTPQAVVNGSEHANGANMLGIAASAETTKPPQLPIAVKRNGDDIEVSVDGTRPGSPAATVIVLPYLASRDVAVGRGENSGTKITYTNIVREIIPLGAWSGSPVKYRTKLSADAHYDGAVVLVQEGTPALPGAILGAERIALH